MGISIAKEAMGRIISKWDGASGLNDTRIVLDGEMRSNNLIIFFPFWNVLQYQKYGAKVQKAYRGSRVSSFNHSEPCI